MKLRKRKAMIAGGAAAAVAAVLGVVLAPIAHASDQPEQRCKNNNLCLFTEHDGKGEIFQVESWGMNQPTLAGIGFSDNVSMVWNKSSIKICLYTDVNYGGAVIVVQPYTAANLFKEADNSVSSIKMC